MMEECCLECMMSSWCWFTENMLSDATGNACDRFDVFLTFLAVRDIS